jgi:hypothetical protein
MNVYKLLGFAGIALAIVAAFVPIPYIAPVLALLGLAVGWPTPPDSHVRVIVSAVALHVLAPAFDEIPAIGPYLTTIIGNLAMGLAGAAIVIILRNVFNRLLR